MIDKNSAAAAILGTLIPQLEYATPVLLDRFDRGLPLVEPKSPSNLGFETGTIDAQWLDLFRALAPCVTAALSYGMLGVLREWLLRDRGTRSQEELRVALVELRMQNVELRRNLDSIAAALSNSVNVPVTPSEVDGAIAAAIARLAQDKQ